MLTYGAQVWYTGHNQKGLVHKLQVTQNEGVRKIAGVFKTTPIEPLHNLLGVPPISYVLPKLIHAYSLRLQGLPPDAKVRTILLTDQCRYWPDYVNPPTNLSRASLRIGPSTYRPKALCTAGAWSHPRVAYEQTPPNPTAHKNDLAHPRESDTHIFIFTYTHRDIPFALYFVKSDKQVSHRGLERGIDQTQALCRAVKVALESITIPNTHRIIIWHRPKTLPEKILTLKPHRDYHLTYDIRSRIVEYLNSSDSLTFTFRHFHRVWPGAPSPADIRGLSNELDSHADTPPHPIHGITPKEAMWNRIRTDYIPSDRPSHMACTRPIGNSLAPAVKAAVEKHSRRLTSLICQLCTGHCFDANYSDTFRSGADDNTTCPCSHIPRRPNHLPRRRIRRHTKEHVVFHCLKTATPRDRHLRGIGSFRTIFQSQDLTSRLCNFLTQSESSLFRPLPSPPRETPEQRPEPWPDPLM